MILKAVLGITGALIVITVVIYFMNRGKTTDEVEQELDRSGDQKGTEVIAKYKQVSKEFSELNTTQMEVAEKMHERHEDAKKVIKESVDRIFDDSEITMTKNEEEKNKIFKELDNI